MNRNEILIVIVLLILIVFVILQIIKKKEKFSEPSELSHNSETCDSYPFDHDECSEPAYLMGAGDLHIQFNSETFPNYHQIASLHMVNPKTPCCLRTCINDFTYTEENTPIDTIDYENKIGTYKEDIPLHLYFASKCSECLDNFYIALKHINRSTKCEEEGDSSVIDDDTSTGCSLRI